MQKNRVPKQHAHIDHGVSDARGFVSKELQNGARHARKIIRVPACMRVSFKYM